MTDNKIILFKHEEFGEIRTLNIDGEPWFVGRDIAEVLGYAKARNAIAKHVDGDDKKDAPIQGTLGGPQNMTIINESGLYSLILSSKLPSARKFRHWITAEVLPSLRKHGAYITAETLHKTMSDPRELAKLLTTLADEQDKRRKLEEENAFLSAGVKDAVQSAVIATSVGNYSNVYDGVREGYSGGYRFSGNSWRAAISTGDVYGRLDQLLGLHNSGGKHIKSNSDGTEFAVYGLFVNVDNAQFAPTSGDISQFSATSYITLEVPLSFCGDILPPMKIRLCVKSKYTPKF